jgi:hypothetical protein
MVRCFDKFVRIRKDWLLNTNFQYKKTKLPGQNNILLCKIIFMQRSLIIIILLLINTLCVVSQQAPAPSVSSFDDMKAGYTGSAEYNEATKTVTFTSSGTMIFPNRLEKTDNIWHIPNTSS